MCVKLENMVCKINVPRFCFCDNTQLKKKIKIKRDTDRLGKKKKDERNEEKFCIVRDMCICGTNQYADTWELDQCVLI